MGYETPVMRTSTCIALLCAFGACPLSAQNGDRRGETQQDLPKDLEVPAAPVLTPAQGLLSLRVPAGFKVELVAAEPLVEDPVAIHFDEDGRIWVAEMRGYMPNVDGKGETAPTGRIVVLEDRDGDGRMDRSTVFLDKLVLPRLVTVLNQGVLVLEPPKLYLCTDKDGDLKCDSKVVIRDGLGGRKSPEHAINGGLLGLDNWIQFAKFGERLRYRGGRWIWEKQLFRGQWGICQDDWGRNYHNTNSDYLRGDFVPAHYTVRNDSFGRLPGANERLDSSQTTWPGRMTPGINRGYQGHMLRDDYTLARFTAACSPVIYRDDLFGPAYLGNAFVCEPAGNFVRRAIVEEVPGGLRARNAQRRSEFLTSTDERFRPVDLKVGPDGGLYVVDMYRGILQHRQFVTTFLRKQILERGLDKPLGLGRIYRVVPRGKPRREVPRLSFKTEAELLKCLASPSGWERDRAQRLLSAHQGSAVSAQLKKLVAEAEDPRTRIHALWTLEGRGELGLGELYKAVGDSHPWVRMHVLRLLEPFASLDDGLSQLMTARLRDPDPRVRCQAVLSLGALEEVPLAEIAGLLGRVPLDRNLRGAVLSAVAGHELDFIKALPAGLGRAGTRRLDGRELKQLIQDLSVCVLDEKRMERSGELVDLVSDTGFAQPAYREELLSGMLKELGGIAKKRRRTRVLELPAPPQDLMIAAQAERKARRGKGQPGKFERLLGHLQWPGLASKSEGVVHDAAAKRLIQKGKGQYLIRCMACHQVHGKGMPGLAPNLVGSPYVLGDKSRLAAILLRGLTGPIKIGDKSFNGTMPPVPGMGDAEIAAIASYIRNAWGQQASVVTPDEVKKVRAAHKDKLDVMLEAEDLEAWGK